MWDGNRLILVIGILAAFVLAIPFCLEEYRIVCEKFMHARPLLAVLLMGIIGFTLGMLAVAWLPRDVFWKARGAVGYTCGRPRRYPECDSAFSS